METCYDYALRAGNQHILRLLEKEKGNVEPIPEEPTVATPQ